MNNKLLRLLNKHSVIIILIIYSFFALLTIIFFNGTGGTGDSVQHYLFAKYAPLHPELFLNHWAKPVFVILASPFASIGFTGIKLFNALVMVMTLYITYKVARELKLKNSVLAMIILMFIPASYMDTFTGLTEPLFALFLILGVYLSIVKKYTTAAILISFLPFVRSEGWIIILVFLLFFLVKKQWRALPWLLTGHVVFSVAGFFVYHDLLWVFTKNPYASIHSPYGRGEPLHYFFELYNATGVPVYLLFWTGLLGLAGRWLSKRSTSEECCLILLGFAIYFMAHSLFWWLGIFNSMGLRRVLTAVFPLLALISLYGFNFLMEVFPWKKQWIPISLQAIIIVYILLFPFTRNPAAIQWKNMKLEQGQLIAREVAESLTDLKITPGRYYYEQPYLNLVLCIDPFNAEKRLNLTKETLTLLKKGDLVIWDHWFALHEGKVTLDYLQKIPGLQIQRTFPSPSQKDKILYAVFIKK